MSGVFWQSKTGSAIRWILTPFAAIVGSFVVYVIAILWCGLQNGAFTVYTGGVEVSSIIKIILFLICQGVCGYAFVFCGTCTAPKYKKNTSIILATVVTILSVASIIFNILSNFDFMNLLGTVCTAIGGIISSCQTSNE